MRGLRKFWFCVSMALPYLAVSYHLGLTALHLGRDLTATGILIGAIGTGIIGITGAFIYGNVKEGPVQ